MKIKEIKEIIQRIQSCDMEDSPEACCNYHALAAAVPMPLYRLGFYFVMTQLLLLDEAKILK